MNDTLEKLYAAIDADVCDLDLIGALDLRRAVQLREESAVRESAESTARLAMYEAATRREDATAEASLKIRLAAEGVRYASSAILEAANAFAVACQRYR